MRAFPFLLLCFFACAGTVRAQITTRGDAVGQKLNAWFATGESAGLHALNYENRDGGHSTFDVKNYPQLSVYQPTEKEWVEKQHIGPANTIRREPTLGNCSMSAAADKGGCLPRLYMMADQGHRFLTNQYLHNNLFIYPEHHDYDPGYHGRGDGWGDLLPTNLPYLVISQGSSLSDLPFVQAFFSTIAALPKETQQGLINNRILMPTLQSIFRRSNRTVQTDEDYFTGKAHPPVFDGGQINEEKMIQIAHDMTPARVPPLVMIQPVSETEPLPGRDFFEAPVIKNEHLGTTPFVIARLFRGSSRSRQMVVSAKSSVDIMRRDLTFRWALLQGDPEKVTIEPSLDGSEARITIAWHPAWELRPNFATHRVDIGVFASNGFAWSAPALITFFMLPNEQRFYDEEGRLQEICYQAGNPDLGLPGIDDPRWLAFARRVASDPQNPVNLLLSRELHPETIGQLGDLANDVAPLQAAWRTLQGDPAYENQAKTAEEKWRTTMRSGLESPSNEKVPLWQSVQNALDRLADDPTLFTSHQETVAAMLRLLPGEAASRFDSALQHALNMLVLARQPSGVYVLHYEPAKLSQGERYQLRQLNLALLSQVLLSEFLDRPAAFAFFDERLTAPKSWRDVYTVDKEGNPLGWSRVSKGRIHQFDKVGRLLLKGPDAPAADVIYTIDPTTKELLFRPK